MNKINIRFIAQSAVIAALYVALTWLLAPISYGAIQFRISEVLILLVVFNPKYAYSLIIGCFIANTTSTLGWYDMVFGTLATCLAILPMLKIRKLSIACLFPVISNAFIVALELLIAFNEPHLFWFNVLTVGLGEAVVLYCLGIPVMTALVKNDAVVDVMKLDTSILKPNNKINLGMCLSIILGVVGIVFYIAYPLYQIVDIEGVTSPISAFEMARTQQQLWTISIAVIACVTIVLGIFTKGFTKFLCQVVLLIGLLICFIFVGVNNKEALSYPYYYGYILYLLVFGLITVFDFKNSKTKSMN